MKKSDFQYELPEALIAQQPLQQRSASRLLLLPPHGAVEDRAMRELPDMLAPGDLVVFNDTRVLPARLFGSKDSGGRVEILVERVLGSHEVRAQVRASKSPRPDSHIELVDGTTVTVLGRDGEFYTLRFECADPVERVLMRVGRTPLPPYIRREPNAGDAERYQTVFASRIGAVAAPTAGLHFDQDLLDALRARGIESGAVTLHVGAGTFQPMRAERVQDHVMHSEWLNVGADVCRKISAARSRGGRVVAVGTTVVRALETAWREGCVRPFAGETRIFIFPGRQVRSIDALLTNFHLPESTLLMLVCAFGGRERVLSAYRHAVSRQYRFFSYGDAMLVFREAAR